MSAINMQDGVVKSSLVQQNQSHQADVARASEQTQVPFNKELARQAEETVRETPQSEHDGIRDDQQGETPQQRRRRRRRQGQANQEDTEKSAPPPAPGSHRLDITV